MKMSRLKQKHKSFAMLAFSLFFFCATAIAKPIIFRWDYAPELESKIAGFIIYDSSQTPKEPIAITNNPKARKLEIDIPVKEGKNVFEIAPIEIINISGDKKKKTTKILKKKMSKAVLIVKPVPYFKAELRKEK